jgi:hypothetical protein
LLSPKVLGLFDQVNFHLLLEENLSNLKNPSGVLGFSSKMRVGDKLKPDLMYLKNETRGQNEH